MQWSRKMFDFFLCVCGGGGGGGGIFSVMCMYTFLFLVSEVQISEV